MSITNDPIHNLLVTYIDRIIKLLRRFGSVDLSVHDLPLRFTFLDGKDKKGGWNSHAVEYFLDKTTYIDNESFAIDATGMTDDPDKYTVATIDAANIERAPGTERRFVLNRETFFTEPPFIFPLGLFQIMRLLERSAQLIDGECTADKMVPFAEDDSEIIQLMMDIECAFSGSTDKSDRSHPYFLTFLSAL